MSSISIQYDVHTQHGIPVYVFRLASLAGPLQQELNAVPEDRRYQRMCVSSDLPDHQRLTPTQCRTLGVHVPLYPSLLFRPPPLIPSSALSDREFSYPLSITYHFNDVDH
jgi:hypothetical protein